MKPTAERCGVTATMQDLAAQLGDLARQLRSQSGRAAWRGDLRLLPGALRWALPWAILGRISRDANPCRWLAMHAQKRPSDLALSDPSQRFTFAELLERVRIVAAALQHQGVEEGQRVALLLPSDANLVLDLLGCWWLGAVPCPIDPDGPISIQSEVLKRLDPDWCVGESTILEGITIDGSRKIPTETLELGKAILSGQPARCPASNTRMVLSTSGSEGRVKLCRITAGRLALSGHAFGGLALGCQRGDVIYCPLPLHHATAITVALMPALVHGVALRLAGKFSVTGFWERLHGSQATQLVYVGDMLRYLLAASRSGIVPRHRLRVAVGNGLDEATWRSVQERLNLARIVEFYGATEAPSVLLNHSGKTGSVGRVPLRRWSRFVVMQPPELSEESANSWRRCEPGEVGELWIRIPRRRRPWLGDFEGYLEASDERGVVVEDVFHPGDRYYRTGDLVRFDPDDFCYFVDRLGDIWRSKGHNVSTIWLADLLRAVDGVEDAMVVPVALDDSHRRFGLAILVGDVEAVLPSLEATLAALPSYARPELVQFVTSLPRTATLKVAKGSWRSKRWDPGDDPQLPSFWRNGQSLVEVRNWSKTRAAILGAAPPSASA